MGLSGAKSLFWITRLLPIEDVLKCIDSIKNETPANRTRRTRITCDANLMGYKFVGKRSAFDPATGVAEMAVALASKQVDIIVTADHPTKRHPSKRATCQRLAE